MRSIVVAATLEAAVRRLRRPRVRLAVADPEQRGRLAAALRTDGCDVELAEIGAAVRRRRGGRQDLHSAEPLDLLVVDAFGLKHAASARRSARSAGLRSVPVILIVAAGSGDASAPRPHLRPDAVFITPFDLDDLRTAVINLVSRW